jgi:asparagine synthase (glutamine-hydrolysing)
MCGIAGIFLRASSPSIPDMGERLTAMGKAERHRGPDDEGVFLLWNGRGGLANQRLAIRDLSPHGHMPMGNDAGTIWITYNGEIYNADELRAELERLGPVFQSHSDTEVILHGYEVWGKGVVDRLRGIFAFAILDTRDSGEVFLARDQLGVKPLYYAFTPEAFVFASELKALLASGLVSREVSPAGLVGYLTLGSVPQPWTIYRDAQALDAGCWLALPLAGVEQSIEPERYWSMPTHAEEHRSERDTVSRVRALLEDAVRRQLVSDVPLGAFLSGGLDSSAVVALMRAATSGTIRTCSMVFEEGEYSEAGYARAMAEAVGAEHYERVITAADVERELDHVLASMDQPTIDGVNTYFVSQTAREAGLTVALSGLGGDELFGGYPNTFKGVPQMFRALQVAERVPGGSTLARYSIDRLPDRHRWIRARDALSQPASPASAYLTRRGLFAPSEVQALLAPDVWESACQTFDAVQYVSKRAIGHEANGTTAFAPFAWVSRAELSTYTQNQLLRDTDVMSMAHSLEVRVPLLDHCLVEAVLKLPAQLQYLPNDRVPKPLLVSAIGHLMPPVIRDRTDKRGFTFPFDRWLRGPLDGQVRSLLGGWTSQGSLQPDAVQDVWQNYQRGKVHWSRLWALVALRSGPLGDA